MNLPLEGVRVIELGHAVAGPFAGSLLSDFGAEIVKIEQPGTGDSLRKMGPKKNGKGLWWAVSGRNKKSVTVNFTHPEGQRLVKRLVGMSEAVIENFRPGVLERHGLDWAALSAVQPKLIMLRVSGFGQSGPLAALPGFGKIAESFGGATQLTGFADRPPVHPGYSLADLLAGIFGAYGIVTALCAIRAGKCEGQLIDLAIYEPLLRMIEWQFPIYEHMGIVPTRNGARFPFGGAFLTGICETGDGRYVVFSAATEASVKRVAELLESKGVASISENALEHTDEMTIALEGWIRSHSAEEVLSGFQEYDIVGTLVWTAKDLYQNQHLRERGNLVTIDDPVLGKVTMPAPVPRFSSLRSHVQWSGPELGEHTDEVLRGILGIDEEETNRLRGIGVL
jgi:crotonobetainyl-CoA:carnitine CoA-transferase CaiB-like acyl-CoA transferase